MYSPNSTPTKKTKSTNKIPLTYRVADKSETNCAPVEVRNSVSLTTTFTTSETRKKIQKRKTYSVLNKRIRNNEKYTKHDDSSSDSETETFKKPFCFHPHPPSSFCGIKDEIQFTKMTNATTVDFGNATGDGNNLKDCSFIEELTKWRVDSTHTAQVMQVYPLWLPQILSKAITKSPSPRRDGEKSKKSLYDESATTSSLTKPEDETNYRKKPTSPIKKTEYHSTSKKWGMKKRVRNPSDIKIIVEKKSFYIKRDVLVKYSLAFRKAIPKTDPLPAAVTLTDIPKDYFVFVKDWMDGKRDVITPSNAAGVLDIAEKLEMPELYKICERAVRTRAGLDDAETAKKTEDKERKEKGDDKSSSPSTSTSEGESENKEDKEKKTKEEKAKEKEEKKKKKEEEKKKKEEEKKRKKEEKEEEKARKKKEKEEEKARKREEKTKSSAASSTTSESEDESEKSKEKEKTTKEEKAKEKEEKKKLKEEEKKKKQEEKARQKEEKEKKKRRKKGTSETSEDEDKSGKTDAKSGKTDKSKGKDKDKKSKKDKDEKVASSPDDEEDEDEEDVMAAWRRRCKLASTVMWSIDPGCEVHHEMLEGKRDEYEQRQKQEEEQQQPSSNRRRRQTYLPPKRKPDKKRVCRTLSVVTDGSRSNISSGNNKKITFDDEQPEDGCVKIISGCASIAVQKEIVMKYSRRLRKLLSSGDDNCDIRPTSITIPKMNEDALYDVGAYLNGAVLCINPKNVKHILEIAEKLDMSVLRHKSRKYQLEVDEGCTRPMEVRIEDDIRSVCSSKDDPCTFDKDSKKVVDVDDDDDEEEITKVDKSIRSNSKDGKSTLSMNSLKSSLKSFKLPIKNKEFLGKIDNIAQFAQFAQLANLDQNFDQIDEIKVELDDQKQPTLMIKMKSKPELPEEEEDQIIKPTKKQVDEATSTTCEPTKSILLGDSKRRLKKTKPKKPTSIIATVCSTTTQGSMTQTSVTATDDTTTSTTSESEYSSPEEPPECKKMPILETVVKLLGWKKNDGRSASLCGLESCKKSKERLLRMTKLLLNHDNIVFGESFCGGNEFAQTRIGNSVGLKFPFDANKFHWVIEDTAPFCHAFCASVLFQGKLYVSGGRVVQGTSPSCEAVSDIWRFDRNELKWRHLGCMAYSRIHHSAIVFQSSIYFIGGLDENLCMLSSVEKMSIKDDSINLTQIAPLSVARAGVACAVNGDLLFVAGGLSKYALQQHGFHVLDLLECYDPRSARWHKLTSLRIPRAFATMITTKKGLHVIGGVTSVNKIDSCLEAIRSVSEVDIYGDEAYVNQQLNMPRYAASAVIHDGRLYVFGGIELETGSYISIVERFSPTSQKWVLANDEFSIQLR